MGKNNLVAAKLIEITVSAIYAPFCKKTERQCDAKKQKGTSLSKSALYYQTFWF